MVSFNCEACNDVIKKPKLDAHKGRCPNAIFSCIDCSTTFQGIGYRSHTSCISEDQKYQGALYREPSKGKKGKQPKMAVEVKSADEKPTEDAEMKEAPAAVDVAIEEPRKEKKVKGREAGKGGAQGGGGIGEEVSDGVEPTAESSKKSKQEKKAKPDATKGVEAAKEAENSTEAVTEAPKEDKRKGKKGKKRKTDDAAEASAADTPAQKPKKAKKDTTASIATAEAFLEQIKTGRPLAFQKALIRVQKDRGEGFNAEALFSVLRLKREKDGSTSIYVAGAREGEGGKGN